jgi:tetratricopeptide (TPR) repeat protein
MVLEAVRIFSLNVEAYPASFNVYDSYGEGLMYAGDTAQAIINYEKSLKINPDNTNAVNILEQLHGK